MDSMPNGPIRACRACRRRSSKKIARTVRATAATTALTAIPAIAPALRPEVCCSVVAMAVGPGEVTVALGGDVLMVPALMNVVTAVGVEVGPGG